MNTLRTRLLVVGLGMLGLSGPVLADREENEPAHAHEKVTMDQLPPEAQKTLQKEAKGQPIKELYKESEHGRTIYEAELMRNGREVEVRVDAHGKLVEHEMHKK